MILTHYKNIQVFTDTKHWIQKHKDIVSSSKNTLYTPELSQGSQSFPCSNPEDKTKIFIGTSMDGARKLIAKGYSDVTVLNFANASTPGGGVRYGASTQEENLCRCTTLYASLIDAHNKNLYYTKLNEYKESPNVLYTKNVIAIKDDRSYEYLKVPFYIDVITCASVNAKKHKYYDPKHEMSDMRVRMGTILRACIMEGRKNIVLGAFGTGAFGNHVEIVARAWYQLLRAYGGFFDNIYMPIFEDKYGIFVKYFQ